MQPTGNMVGQDTFAFNYPKTSLNEKAVLFYELFQELSIWDITNIAYLPEGYVLRGHRVTRVFHVECKVH